MNSSRSSHESGPRSPAIGVACLVALGSFFLSSLCESAHAAPDPAAVQADAFNSALLSAMHASSPRDRLDALTPQVSAIFNIPVMSSFVIGEPWGRLPMEEKIAVNEALTRYLAARYVHDLSGMRNVSLTTTANVTTRGSDKLVHTLIAEGKERPDALDYRMREYAGAWKIIDVYANGVSELATRRADVADVLASGGVKAVAIRIRQAADNLTAK